MFEKLHQKPVVKSCGIQKIDMSLAFSQSAGGVNGTRYLNFLGFCHLMLSFYEKKMVKQYGYSGEFNEFVDACLQ